MGAFSTAPQKVVGPTLIKIFLSSPGDVNDERNLARALIKEELPYLPFFQGRVAFYVESWDDPSTAVPMFANETPQASLTRGGIRPATCDITVVILKSKMGTPLPDNILKPNGDRFVSGTEWEYFDACESLKEHKDHELLVYRCTEKPKVELDDPDYDQLKEQYEKVKTFFSQFTNEDGSLGGGVNKYDTPTAFAELLRKHLQKIVWERVKSSDGVPATAVSEPQWSGPPYPGLRPFRIDEAKLFFGRGRETDELIRKLRDTNPCFVTVVGDSGTGKSSLVYAGVLPRLMAGALEGRPKWSVVSCRPAYLGENPLLSLSAALMKDQPDLNQHQPGGFAEKLRQSSESIQELITPYCAGQPDGGNLILFVDQFEELFTQCAEEFRAPFVEALRSAITNGNCRVIATLRADFLPAASALSELESLLQNGTFPLGPPGTSGLFDAIRRPAAIAGIAVDDELVDALLKDAGADQGTLPLLAFCLRQLYASAAEHATLSLSEYEKLGGLRGALSKHADAVVKEIEDRYGAPVSRELDFILASLVTVDVSGRPTRQRALRSTLSANGDRGNVVDALIAGRLLVESGTSSSTVELAHEVLFDSWPDLMRWVDRNRADLLAFTELLADVKRWERAGRDENYLLRGNERVQLATRLRDQRKNDLDEAGNAFIEESIRRARLEEQTRTRMLLYEQARAATLKRYVQPYLERQIQELANNRQEQEVTSTQDHFDMDSARAIAEAGISEITNLLSPSGRWHPEFAQPFGENDNVWAFPCCGKKSLGSEAPSQYRADGCQPSPYYAERKI